jgi:hypothetical protein
MVLIGCPFLFGVVWPLIIIKVPQWLAEQPGI